MEYCFNTSNTRSLEALIDANTSDMLDDGVMFGNLHVSCHRS